MIFESDIREYLTTAFDSFGVTYNPSAEIDKDILNLFTIKKKYIFQRPRTVEISRELLIKMKSSPHSPEILHLKLLFLNGGDVNPFQTTDLFNHHRHDDLVYDWNIYHFHLTTKKTRYEYFNDRTKDILFAYVESDFTLFLNIEPHTRTNKDVFADSKLIEIIDNNWPETLKAPKDITGTSFQPTKSERFRLRKSQINEAVLKVNNKYVYPPGFGSVTSGHSSEAADKLIFFIRWLGRVSKNKIIMDSIDRYKLLFYYDGPKIVDKENGEIVASYN